MAPKRGFLGYNALLGDGSVLSAYQPTLRERLTDGIARLLFSDDREGVQRAEKVMDVLSFTPVGMAADVYDAGREAGAGNYGTAGLMLGMAGIPGPSPKKGIRAFHGSPHSFDRFDMSKIGTGEGAQAYGHGLYFAENEGVARGYQKNVKDNASIANVNNRLRDLVKIMDADSAGGYRQFKSDVGRNAAIEYDELLEKRQEIVSAPGSMYEVNINADPEQFLDWDKPLSEQPENVRQGLQKLGISTPEVRFSWNGYDGNIGFPTAGGAWTLFAQFRDTGKGIKAKVGAKDIGTFSSIENARAAAEQAIKNAHGVPQIYGRDAYAIAAGGNPVAIGARSNPEAAKRLLDVNIPGIKYLDAGSRGAGDGTRNYVVFDDRLIEIVRKYGIAGASAMLGYNILEGMDPAQADELKRIEGGR